MVSIGTHPRLSGGPALNRWEDALVGYWSAGVTASTALPLPHRFGVWRLDVGVTYLALCTESTRLQNNGSFYHSLRPLDPPPEYRPYGSTVSGEDHAWDREDRIGVLVLSRCATVLGILIVVAARCR